MAFKIKDLRNITETLKSLINAGEYIFGISRCSIDSLISERILERSTYKINAGDITNHVYMNDKIISVNGLSFKKESEIEANNKYVHFIMDGYMASNTYIPFFVHFPGTYTGVCFLENYRIEQVANGTPLVSCALTGSSLTDTMEISLTTIDKKGKITNRSIGDSSEND